VLEDSDKQITSMYFQIALEPDAVTGFCKNRAKGVLLPWQAIPKWNSSKQVFLSALALTIYTKFIECERFPLIQYAIRTSS
jgi:hypothetical protein